MAAFTVDVDPGLAGLASWFESAGSAMDSFEEPLTRAVERVVAPSIAQNFEVGGRPAWAPLEAGTLDQTTGGSVLIRTGLLRDTASDPQTFTIDGESARIEDLGAAWYGEIHDNGDGFGVIPARPFLLFQEEDIDAIAEIFEEWVQEQLDFG